MDNVNKRIREILRKQEEKKLEIRKNGIKYYPCYGWCFVPKEQSLKEALETSYGKGKFYGNNINDAYDALQSEIEGQRYCLEVSESLKE